MSCFLNILFYADELLHKKSLQNYMKVTNLIFYADEYKSNLYKIRFINILNLLIWLNLQFIFKTLAHIFE